MRTRMGKRRKQQMKRTAKKLNKLILKLIYKLFRKALKYTALFVTGILSAIVIYLYQLEQILIAGMNKLSFRTKFALFVLIIGFLAYTRNTTINTTEIMNIIHVNKIVERAEAEEEFICEYGVMECKIIAESMNQGLTLEEGKMIVAISKAETGYYTSYLCVEANNPGGLYYNGRFMKFDTIEEGISKMIRELKAGYFDQGLNTLEKIQPKYAPIGAANDPTDLNRNWLPNVTDIYNKMN